MSSTAAASKIPVASHRRQSNGGSPERTTQTQQPRGATSPPLTVRQRGKESSSSIPKDQRPQSIDIEDEFNNKLQYGRLLASINQQMKNNGTAEVTSPSRIPVASSRKLSSGDVSEKSSNECSPLRSSSASHDDALECLISSSPSSCSKVSSRIPRMRSGSPPKSAFGFGPELNKSPTKNAATVVPFSPLGPPTTRKSSNGSNSSSHEQLQHSSSSSSSTSSSSSSSSTQKSSSSSDSATEQLIANNEDSDHDKAAGAAKKKKNYEAFTMTGDRMICLAKTPANSEFLMTKTTNMRASGGLEKVPFQLQEEEEKQAATPLIRASNSEDQLQSVIPDLGFEDDNASGSVDTLLVEHDTVPKKIAESSPIKRHSPDFSTSSLISSEHYNGESLLDQDNLSPRSSSSPDTPEWSLVDSFHKQKSCGGSDAKVPLLPIEDVDDESIRSTPVNDDIKSEGNRVIITIGTNNNDLNGGGSYRMAQEAAGPTTLNDSSEESDLESLRSYHPPARTIDFPSAERLAKRLFNLDGFKRTDVSRHLGKNNEFSQVVAEEYLRFFEFGGGISLDNALRIFLNQFCLTGETQERERVLLHFSRRYLECNPEFITVKQHFRSLDAVHTLTCAIMLLNTDLHGDSVGLQRKMTCNEFIENLSELNDGQNFPRDLLRSIYYAVKETPIPWAPSEDMVIIEEASQSIPIIEAKKVEQQPEQQQLLIAENFAIGQTGGGINPFLALPDPSTAVDYKKGYVMRKCCMDPNGKRTKMGKRSWRMFFLTLRDMVLYCFKDEQTNRHPGAFEDFSSAIRIHHGLAVRASDYVKKQFVFRLYTADRAEYLFQTSDEKELLTWIDAINYVVASFSSPQLPAGCSSGGRFQRPLMPSAKSGLTMAAELDSHEAQLQQYRRDIEDHLQSPPAKNAKAAVCQNHSEKTAFLKFEIMRYETYILTLRTKNAHDT